MARKNKITAAAASALIGVLMTLLPAAGHADVYVGGATVVYKQSGQPPQADKGTLVCLRNSGTAVGGGCLPFGQGNYVHVSDLAMADKVAFQVCIDNNGDGVCTDAPKQPDPRACADQIFFSHDDQGNFHNPIGPLPTGPLPGCGGAPWNGYIVFLCQGVHFGAGGPDPAGGVPHTHKTTVGTIGVEATGTPSGFGDFCGGAGRAVVSKPYEVIG